MTFSTSMVLLYSAVFLGAALNLVSIFRAGACEKPNRFVQALVPAVICSLIGLGGLVPAIGCWATNGSFLSHTALLNGSVSTTASTPYIYRAENGSILSPAAVLKRNVSTTTSTSYRETSFCANLELPGAVFPVLFVFGLAMVISVMYGYRELYCPKDHNPDDEEVTVGPKRQKLPKRGPRINRPILGGHCPVCLNKYLVNEAIQILSCGHGFHSTCIRQWLQLPTNVQSCPVCRCEEPLLAQRMDYESNIMQKYSAKVDVAEGGDSRSGISRLLCKSVWLKRSRTVRRPLLQNTAISTSLL